jgi:hypothetical protein
MYTNFFIRYQRPMVVSTIFRNLKIDREDAVFRCLSFGHKKIYERASLSRSAFPRGALRVSANLQAHLMIHDVSKQTHIRGIFNGAF